jgi:UDP-N-acetylmuramoyl-L-alanyl-D-glutamate--2,6-diaminopimelate ligase
MTDAPSEALADPLRASRPQHPPRRPLTELAAWLAAADPSTRTHGDLRGVATGVTLASQRVLPGDVYAALPGSRAHGIDYAAAAVEAGAVAVLTDLRGTADAPAGVPVLEVAAPRSLLGRFAAHLYGDPARSLRMLGVTGTQGKTTTTRLAESALQRAGVRSAVVGTVGTRLDGEEIKTALTTPEAPELHGLFALMKERSVAACAVEVSSHALVQGRVDGVVFDVAVFTNLGRDHLDFHADLEDYFQAKASLFTPERCVRGLVNVDDEHGRRLLAEAVDRGVPLQSFSAQGAVADWRAGSVEVTASGSRFVMTGPGGVRVEVGCPLPGAFNVANALAALASCALLGFDLEPVARAMSQSGGVPGRLERVDAGQDFTLVVDYAHKPDAVTAALAALRPLTGGRLIAVLGAGGERDHGKRPIMGGIAARLADVLIVTDDNPRGEEPASIRAEILAGTRGGSAEVLEVADRRSAIREAVGLARAGDVVLVAGKGHETGQEVAGVVHPFDDREVAREELVRLGSAT